MAPEAKRSGRFFLFMIPAFFLWLIGQYFFPVVATDQLNVVVPYLIENMGWTPKSITDPGTVGRLLAIPMTLVWGNLIIKFGGKPLFCASLFMFGVCQFLVAFHVNYVMYFIGFCIIPILGTAILMSTFSLVRNWFRDWRGTALGIVTLVSPLGNATIISYLTWGVAKMGFTASLSIMAGILVITGIVGLFIVREKPEKVGCFPDGALVAPPPEILANDDHVNRIRVYHLLRHKEAWFHFILFGIFMASLAVYPAFFVDRFAELGFTPAQGIGFAYGFSIFGGILSLISGIIDDKLGTRNATIMMSTLFFLGTIGLRFGSPEHPWMIWFGIVALGGIVGAGPNLNPSLVIHIYGRKCFDHVYKYINTGVYILPAGALFFVTRLADIGGGFNLPYTVMIPISFVGLLFSILIKKKIDLTADVDDLLAKKAEVSQKSDT